MSCSFFRVDELIRRQISPFNARSPRDAALIQYFPFSILPINHSLPLQRPCTFSHSVWWKSSTQIHSRSLAWLEKLNVKDKNPSLENAVDNVATDCGTGSENSSISHLLAEFLALFFEFAVFPAFRANLGARLG